MQRAGSSRGRDKSIMSKGRNRNTVLGISFFFRLLDLVCKLDDAVVEVSLFFGGLHSHIFLNAHV